MIIPKPFTGNESFWEINAQYAFIFDEFYKKDRTKNKHKSSKVMWAITLRCHPGSDFYNLSGKDELIVDKFVKDKDFKFEDYDDIQELFMDSVLTPAEKSLYNFYNTLKKRDIFIHAQEYSLDYYKKDSEGNNIQTRGGGFITEKGTADQLDKMLANTSKLYDEYFKIKKQLLDEEVKRGKGDKPMSLSDSSQI